MNTQAKVKQFLSRVPGIRTYFAESFEEQRRNAECWLISMPSSGRTWLRYALGRAYQRQFGFEKLNPFDLYSFGIRHRQIPTIKLLHEPFKGVEEYQDKAIIILVRDPRDVLVSNYFGSLKRTDHLYSKSSKYTDSINNFVMNSGYLDELIDFYNNWHEHREAPKSFLRVRYEDLKADTFQEVRRVIDFLEVPIADEHVRGAVEDADFQNMRKLEKQQKYEILTPGDSKDESSYKTRKGKAGGYKEHLSVEELTFIDKELKAKLEPSYGYNYDSASQV